MTPDITHVDPDPKEKIFPCIRLVQPLGEFYIASMPRDILCAVADFDVRRVLQEDRDVERYLGIQRPLIPRRVASLEQYVNFVDATFPTAIIIAVDEDYVKFNEEDSTMTISNVGPDGRVSTAFRHIARVIDGQHRIAGLYKYEGEVGFDINVTIFVGMDIADQAQIFSTVNLEQTKVNRSLAYDLFALAHSRSPQKTCHNIAVALDSDTIGPLFKRIKRLGVASKDEYGIPLPGREGETITQARFVESLIVYLTSDRKLDRDRLLRGESLLPVDDDELKIRPFRNLFVSGEEGDFAIADIVGNFFDAVRERWPQGWADTRRGGLMLCRTNGFAALMRVLRPAYISVAAPGSPVRKSQFSELLAQARFEDSDFTTENFPPGSGGEAELRQALLEQMGLEE